MTELSRANPTGRFSGLAELYARCRPGYPEESIDYIVERCKLGRQTLVVDVGCGTGISSRMLAHRSIPVVGIEPNAEMRALAAAENFADPAVAPRYCEGRAEATNLADATAGHHHAPQIGGIGSGRGLRVDHGRLAGHHAQHGQ